MKKITIQFIGFITLLLLGLITVPSVHGQIPGGQNNGGDDQTPIPVPTPVIDVSMLTNRAALANYARAQIGAVTVKVSVRSAVNSPQSTVYEYTDTVKSFDGISRLLEGQQFNFQVTGTNEYVDIRFGCFPNLEEAYQSLYNEKGSPLFNGYAGGSFVEGKVGQFYLPDYASHPNFYLGPTIRVHIPGAVEARFIRRNEDGSYPNEQPSWITVIDGWLFVNSDFAGAGELVLTTGDNEHGYRTGVYDLRRAGAPMPLNNLFVRLGKADRSPDVIPLRDASSVEVVAYSFMGYGSVPLIEIVNESMSPEIRFSVTSNEAGRNATRLVVKHEESGRTWNLEAFEGQAVLRNAPPGTYHVIPHMPITSWPSDSSGPFGGGKGPLG